MLIYINIKYEYNNRNKLIKSSVLDKDNKQYYTEYEYDKFGNNTEVRTANGQNVTTYSYDSLNRVSKMTDPLGKYESYGYDIAGNMISKYDRNGTRFTYEYDALNRLTKEYATVAGKEVIKTQNTYYDKNDKSYIKQENSTGTLITEYAKLGVPNNQQIHQANENYRINYSYGSDNTLSAKNIYRTNNYNDTINQVGSYQYYYDALNRMVSAREENLTTHEKVTSADYKYDANSNIISVKYTNGTMATYEYNYANLVTAMYNKKGSTILSSYSYTYNYDGNQSSKKDNKGSVNNYIYDNLGRLTNESTATSSTTYRYDTAGNRVSMIDVTGGSTTQTDYTYDANNRMISKNVDYGDKNLFTSYGYDNNGNQLYSIESETDNTDINTPYLMILNVNEIKNYKHQSSYYTYDVFNRLTNYSNGKGKKATYTYFPNNLRASKSVNGITTYNVWDGDNLLLETNGSGTVKNQYVRGLSLIKKADNSTYYHYNAHGDVIQLTDSTGNITTDYTYDAFGVQKDATNQTTQTSKTNKIDSNPFRYCGEYQDEETGLVYLRNRYYNPEIGRFINEDTHWNQSNMVYGDKEYKEGETKYPDYKAIMQSGNLYGYCINNPIRYTDVYGENSQDVFTNMHRFAWKVVVNKFREYGYELTARLLELSVSGKENPAFYGEDDTYAAKLLKKHNGFRKAINDLIYENGTKQNKNEVHFKSNYTFDTGTGDLGAALHNVNYEVTGKKINGEWNVTVKVTDIFDFTEYVNIFEKVKYTGDKLKHLKELALWTGNNVAVSEQEKGVIKPVDVTIVYHDKFK